MSLANSILNSPTRLFLICTALLLILYTWRSPFRSTQPPPTGFIPNKLYEPKAQYCTDNVADETPKIFENPKAPAFPGFKSSAHGLPSAAYNPYPEYSSRAWHKRWRGTHIPCMGPRGVVVNGHADDIVFAHRYTSKGFHQHATAQQQPDFYADQDEEYFTDGSSYAAPKPIIGSYHETGLESDFCFDRHARYDPYGYDEGEGGKDGLKLRSAKVDWDNVNWGALQNDCFVKNGERYEPYNRTGVATTFWLPKPQDIEDVDKTLVFPPDGVSSGKSFFKRKASHKSYKQRQAVVLRTWDGNEWTVDTMQYVRSYIMELALHSGVEYEVIVLVEVKDDKKKIIEDPKVYKEVLEKSVPDEFADLALLFNNQLLDKWYPKTGKHGRGSQAGHMHQPMQLLSLLRPDIDHFWQLELDVRYTGHHYHLLETISAWSDAQPRKHQWERASHFYVPAVHGTWTSFTQRIANTTADDGGIWGADPTEGIAPIGPDPPTDTPEKDNYEWGVGEEADLVNLAPIFDATDSKFPAAATKDNYPGGKSVPARATATTAMQRYSKRLLRAMHHGQATSGFHMLPEMYAASTALHHGLKVVVFPLPVYLDFARSPKWVEKAFNEGDGARVSERPFKYEAEWRRMTFWAALDQVTVFSDELYKRFLGYSAHGAERICLPGILLHPVKGV